MTLVLLGCLNTTRLFVACSPPLMRPTSYTAIYIFIFCALFHLPRHRQHYCCDSSSKIEETACTSTKAIVATQAQLYCSAPSQDRPLVAHPTTTSQCWIGVQSPIHQALDQNNNGSQEGEEEATGMEVPTMQKSQQRQRPLVSVVLADMGSCARPTVRATNKVGYTKRNKDYSMDYASNAELAWGRMVAQGAPSSEGQKCVTQSYKEAERRSSCKGSVKFSLCSLFCLSVFRSGDLHSSINVEPMGGQRYSCQGLNGPIGCPDTQCRAGGGDPCLVSRPKRHACENERNGHEIRPDVQEVHGVLHGTNMDILGTNGGETQIPPQCQAKPSLSVAKKPAGNNIDLGRSLQGLQHTTGRIFQIDCRHDSGDGNNAPLTGYFVQASWRSSSTTDCDRGLSRRNCSQVIREGTSSEADVCLEDMHSYGYGQAHSSGQRLRRSRSPGWRLLREAQGQTGTRCRGCIVKFGSRQPCLRNSCCVPTAHPRTVRFTLPDNAVDFDIEDGPDSSDIAETPTMIHSLLLEDDCVFLFQAFSNANNLAMDLFFERTYDFLNEIQVNLHAWAPLPSTVLSQQHFPDEDPNNNYSSDLAPLTLQETVLGPNMSYVQTYRTTDIADVITWEIESHDPMGHLPNEQIIPLNLQPSWIQQLHAAWTNLQRELPRPEAELQVRSWFLDPTRYTRWERWRPITLTISADHWWNLVKTVWFDVLDDAEGIDVHFVHPAAPRPPADLQYPFDIIVTQRFEQYQKPTLVVSRLLTLGARFYTIAELLPATVSKWELIYLVENDRFCSGISWGHDFHRLCLVWRDMEEVTARPTAVQLGDCFTIDIYGPRQIPALYPEPEEDDDFAFMGRNPVVIRPQHDELDHLLEDDMSDDQAHAQPGRWYTAIMFVLGHDEKRLAAFLVAT